MMKFDEEDIRRIKGTIHAGGCFLKFAEDGDFRVYDSFGTEKGFIYSIDEQARKFAKLLKKGNQTDVMVWNGKTESFDTVTVNTDTGKLDMRQFIVK